MFSRYNDLFLLDREEIGVIRMRRHWAALLNVILQTVGITSATFALSQLPDWQMAQSLLWCLTLGAVLRFAWKLLEWWKEIIIVTDRRIIFQDASFFIALKNVTNVTLRSTMSGRLLDYGTLFLELTGHKHGRLAINYVPMPEKIFPTISDLVLAEKQRLPEPQAMLDATVPTTIQTAPRSSPLPHASWLPAWLRRLVENHEAGRAASKEASLAMSAEEHIQKERDAELKKSVKEHLAECIATYQGVRLFPDRIVRLPVSWMRNEVADSFPLVGVSATVETAGNVYSRGTIVRNWVLTGWQKKIDTREAYLVINGPEFQWVLPLQPDQTRSARQFAALVTTFGRRASQFTDQ